MIEATSCGGVVIYRGKILTLYKSYRHKYEGWVLPKGTVEEGEDYKDTALREVKEEAGVSANIIKYIGKSQYSFCIPEDTVEKNSANASGNGANNAMRAKITRCFKYNSQATGAKMTQAFKAYKQYISFYKSVLSSIDSGKGNNKAAKDQQNKEDNK